MARGRKPSGAKLVEGLEGSEAARQRLQVVLKTLAGEMSVADACQTLGLSEAGFYKLRAQFLQDAVGLLEPKKPGRKPKEVGPEQQRIQELEAEKKDLVRQLDASMLRTEIALVMPHLLKGELAQAKKTPKPERKGKRKKRKR
jgi:transposase-like protein